MKEKYTEVSEADSMLHANAFEEIRSECVRCFNTAYDGYMPLDAFIDRLNWIKAMCDRRIERAQS